ncbi:hypothetical protein DOY81_001743 [Sarcophaga bullata]|nr:hypothetical protein DOY81_001743 [Sarcophaga bullata]
MTETKQKKKNINLVALNTCSETANHLYRWPLEQRSVTLN